jgi:hypothetical protein
MVTRSKTNRTRLLVLIILIGGYLNEEVTGCTKYSDSIEAREG